MILVIVRDLMILEKIDSDRWDTLSHPIKFEIYHMIF